MQSKLFYSYPEHPPYRLTWEGREFLRDIGIEPPDRPLDVDDLRRILKAVKAENRRLDAKLAGIEKRDRKGKAPITQVEHHCELCASPVIVSTKTSRTPIVFCDQQCCDRYVQVEGLTPEDAVIAFDADGKIQFRA